MADRILRWPLVSPLPGIYALYNLSSPQAWEQSMNTIRNHSHNYGILDSKSEGILQM